MLMTYKQHINRVSSKYFDENCYSVHFVCTFQRVIELDDETDLSGELACAGGACEIV